MSYYELLPFRSPNVVQQLTLDQDVPLLNGRHLLKAAASLPGCVCWAPGIHDGAAMVGLLRAAAHQKTFIGLTMMPRSADRQQLKQVYSPRKYFRTAVEAASQLNDAPPFFLHVQEPPIQASKRADFEAVRDHIASCVEAGFTSFGLDLSHCDGSQVPQAAGELLQPVLDFDLGIAIRLPKPESKKQVVVLRKQGIEPSLIVLSGPDELDDEAVPLASQLEPLFAPVSLAWCDCKKNATVLTRMDGLNNRPVKALIGGERFAFQTRLSASEIETDKLEALVYMEAFGLLEKLGGRSAAFKLAPMLRS